MAQKTLRIYFSGIGGMAIGPLALICRDVGYSVTGSDLARSRFTDLLEKSGVAIAFTQDESHIRAVHAEQPIDWLVVSAALPPDHPVIQFAHQAGIKVTQRDDMINLILRNEGLAMVAVSGTHGKTTTTAMLTWLFKQFNLPVSYSIGTSISFGPSGAYQPGSQYFVYECDEFNRTMLAFNPAISFITNVEYDHPDTYPTSSDYDQAFIQFARQSGQLVMWDSDALRLGLEERCTVILDPTDTAIADINLAGMHNRRNAWGAAHTFRTLFPHYSLADIIAALAIFPGTDRRFERLANGIYSDYAHHPTEIAATIQLAKELNPHVIVVYQPHQNVRQHAIQHDYTHCFDAAAKIYWLPTFLAREDPGLATLTPSDLMSNLADPTHAEVAAMDETLAEKVRAHANAGDLVVCMGAGTIDGWARTQFAHPQE